jgi:hypothetical protein
MFASITYGSIIFLSDKGVLNRDPTIWLDGARPEAIFLVMCDPSVNAL